MKERNGNPESPLCKQVDEQDYPFSIPAFDDLESGELIGIRRRTRKGKSYFVVKTLNLGRRFKKVVWGKNKEPSI